MVFSFFDVEQIVAFVKRRIVCIGHCGSDRLVIKLQNFSFEICASGRFMVGHRAPFASAQNFGHEKLKIKSKILLKGESKVIENIILKGLWLKTVFV